MVRVDIFSQELRVIDRPEAAENWRDFFYFLWGFYVLFVNFHVRKTGDSCGRGDRGRRQCNDEIRYLLFPLLSFPRAEWFSIKAPWKHRSQRSHSLSKQNSAFSEQNSWLENRLLCCAKAEPNGSRRCLCRWRLVWWSWFFGQSLWWASPICVMSDVCFMLNETQSVSLQ